ncbi:MAG TPA: TonB-dependent receptor, partial [Terriglobales bacterium]|nr:TonB-dependent receptor [Terriglobales bacterium]
TQSSELASVIDERAIGQLPINGRRFTDLVLLTPGVTQDPRSLTSSSNGDLSFGGIRGYNSSYLVDGSDNNNAFFGQARGRYRAPYQFSNEVVQEFRVSSNSYGAELGRSGGAVVNVVTKSGSNRMHGSLFYYLRDSAFNAQPGFLDFKPTDRQQQFGFTAGGPIRRNKIFFFTGFDQHVFEVPSVVRFLDGSSQIVPVAHSFEYPTIPGDYDSTDKTRVLAAAQQLNSLAGNFQSRLVGNTGFFKLDMALTPRHYISARVNTSRYYGENNVFFDPASPITSYAISDNGEEDVATESVNVSLTSALTSRLTSHLRVQFSRDLQESSTNSNYPLTRIYDIIDGFGRSTILPRRTNEHRVHIADTLSLTAGRHTLKLGGDILLTKLENFFPSMFGGEYIFDNIRANPFTWEPMTYGLHATALRAYAHNVPRYYIQNFGSAVSHPDTNEYSWFAQDTLRVTDHLALNLGVRYDLQTFNTKGLVTNPLWPDSGKLPYQPNNFSPRVGFAYSIGDQRPIVIRGGYGLFYTRIPSIYTSAIETDNGLNSFNLILDNSKYADHQLFPTYPNPLVNCPLKAPACAASAALAGNLTTEISSFAHNFVTPRVHQASFSIEREIADRLAVGISYLYVHGENLIRARDVNLPEPITVQYPVYDPTGSTFLGDYYTVNSFSTWQFTDSMTCPYPPCVNPLKRPIPQIGAINVFESAASSDYHGFTASVRRRMTNGLYFRAAYTWARAVDDGQDALVAGRPSTVENSYAPNQWGPSVTDQRNRFVLSWIAEPRPFHRSHEILGLFFNDWRFANIVTYGSGRPVDARIFGDANGDDNTSNDRLPGTLRNSFVGPNYATLDFRITRSFHFRERWRLEFIAEAFNLLNRDNQRMTITDDGFNNNAGTFVPFDNSIGNKYFPGYYRKSPGFLQPTSAYAPRQVQLALKLTF